LKKYAYCIFTVHNKATTWTAKLRDMTCYRDRTNGVLLATVRPSLMCFS